MTPIGFANFRKQSIRENSRQRFNSFASILELEEQGEKEESVVPLVINEIEITKSKIPILFNENEDIQLDSQGVGPNSKFNIVDMSLIDKQEFGTYHN